MRSLFFIPILLFGVIWRMTKGDNVVVEVNQDIVNGGGSGPGPRDEQLAVPGGCITSAGILEAGGMWIKGCSKYKCGHDHVLGHDGYHWSCCSTPDGYVMSGTIFRKGCDEYLCDYGTPEWIGRIESVPYHFQTIANGCYRLIGQSESWEAHRNTCLEAGADLAKVPSDPNDLREFLGFISDKMNNEEYWVGARRADDDEFYHIKDNTPVVYYHWYADHPDTDGDCVVFDTYYHHPLYNADCEHSYYGICEFTFS